MKELFWINSVLINWIYKVNQLIYLHRYIDLYIYRKQGDLLNSITFYRAHLKGFKIILYEKANLKTQNIRFIKLSQLFTLF